MIRKTIFKISLLVSLVFAGMGNGFSQEKHSLEVDVDQVKAEVQNTMWGLFFEDINMGADGGIYAELIKNRSFEFDVPMMGWEEQKRENGTGEINIHNVGEKNPANRRYARIKIKSDGGYGLMNEGFRGMGVKAGELYDFSLMARQVGDSRVSLTIELVNPKGEVIGTTSITPKGEDWAKYETSFKVNVTEAEAKLRIWANHKGTIDVDMISLFPQDTWMGRKGGLRKDMVQLLADFQPGFLRFPGGCIVEGRTLDERFDWKKTIGKPEERHLIVNKWNMDFKHRPTPDYFQSFGLGFFEYFVLAEDLGAEPVPILNCGMACQFISGELVPMDQLDPYIQDALDLIEFANAPVDTEWGKKREEMGHPEPFNMKYLGIGNEQWGEQYVERFVAFEKVLKEKHPEIVLISSTGPFHAGKEFDYLDKTLRELNVELIDEHFYNKPEWFLENVRRYDNYDRKGPKIFAGEYAAQSVATVSPENKNNWFSAVTEAAFMTGLERNADVVIMASYAPLFAHAEAWQWTPDMIWVDNLNAYGTPNYYVQKLYATNKGSHVVSITEGGNDLVGQDQLYASATIDTQSGEVILKIVNTSDQHKQVECLLNGVKKLQNKGLWTELTANNLDQMNSFDDPKAIYPFENTLKVKGNLVNLSLKPYSLNVIKVKTNQVLAELVR